MQLRKPKVSFGVPVYNAERYLPHLLDSILAQDFQDFEIVICDNDSTDQTQSICRAYAQRDQRVRFHWNDCNIGQVANVNRVFELSRGEYYRFIGADDWLEPDYLTKCVNMLDERPETIGVSTFQDFIDDEGNRYYSEYEGERFESSKPHRRFARMLWFTNANYLYVDPLYCLIRSDAMRKTKLCQMLPRMDGILAAELALIGDFQHIPECLAHRRREHKPNQATKEAILQRFHPTRWRELEHSNAKICNAYMTMIRESDMNIWEKANCTASVAKYFTAAAGRDSIKNVKTTLRNIPGYQFLKAVARPLPAFQALWRSFDQRKSVAVSN